jgi:hypothetical protein
MPMILSETHEGIFGGYYAGKVMAQNILRIVLCWHTLHRDTKDFYQTCDVYQ